MNLKNSTSYGTFGWELAKVTLACELALNGKMIAVATEQHIQLAYYGLRMHKIHIASIKRSERCHSTRLMLFFMFRCFHIYIILQYHVFNIFCLKIYSFPN